MFIFSHTSHVLATFAKTSDMIVNSNIKVSLNMRIHFISPSCLSLHHPIQSLRGKAQIKPITNISLLSILWAFLMLMIPSTTNAEALSNGDNHLTRSKIFEEQGNSCLTFLNSFNLWKKFNILGTICLLLPFFLNVRVYIYHVGSLPIIVHTYEQLDGGKCRQENLWLDVKLYR